MSSSSRASSRKDEDSLLSFLRELPVLLLVAFVLAFLLRTFVVQVFYIPSSSMVPTLQEQDRMVVEKISYAFREPQRGEVVVFAGEEFDTGLDTSTISNIVTGIGRFLGVVPADARDFVKRVIGLPGETVVIEDGVVMVDGTPIDEPFVVNGDDRSFGPFEVPEGKLFVLGDNRPNSADSRFGLGFVDIENVVGRAAFVLWPLDHAGSLDSFGLEDVVGDPADVDTAGTTDGTVGTTESATETS